MALNLLPLFQSIQTIICWLEKVEVDGDESSAH